MKAGKREWIGLGVLLLPLLLVSMDVSVLYFAMPFIDSELRPTSTQQLWIYDVYGFVLAGLLITMGALGDRIGRRRLLLLGAGAFALTSVAAAYATSADMLIAARALLGIGGATLMPSTLGLIRNMFHDEKQRATAVAIWTAGLTFGVSLGPILSGFLLEHFWWGSVFLINAPFMVMLLLLAPVLVPEFRNPVRGRFDLIGSALSLAAVLPVIYGIKEMAAHGVSPARLATVAVGLLIGVAFLARQRTARAPMVDLNLFRSRAFGGALVVNSVAMFALVGFAIFMTQFLQAVLGMRPLEGALWSLVGSAGVMVAAPIATVLGQRGVPKGVLVAGGFLMAAIGFVVLSRVTGDSPLWIVLVGASVEAGGLVVVMSLGTELVVGAAPPERAGTASALVETGSELGGAIGIALLGSLGAAIYRADMANSVGGARETIGGALAVARTLRRDDAASVIHAARAAFIHGMQGVALAAIGVMLLAAALALFALRRNASQSQSHSQAQSPAAAPAQPASVR
jgi:DHA2 family multidrug resistance protein-like MFS transporter